MTARQAHRQDGFTLTELMIAVLVLVVVIVGTSKIFGTASKVTGLGEASADVLQETAAIERRIRTDLANLSPEGFFMIRAVAVRNDLNTPSGPLLNPVLAPNAWIRADQLMFFTQGAQVIETMGTRLGAENSDDLRAQGMVSRVYYGPAFQLPQAGKAETSDGGATMHAHDAQLDLSNPLVPWYNGTYPTVRTPFKMVIPWGDYPPAFDGEINATQPPANRWLLARHALILADDQDAHLQDPLGSQYLSHPTANTIGDGVVLNGR